MVLRNLCPNNMESILLWTSYVVLAWRPRGNDHSTHQNPTIYWTAEAWRPMAFFIIEGVQHGRQPRISSHPCDKVWRNHVFISNIKTQGLEARDDSKVNPCPHYWCYIKSHSPVTDEYRLLEKSTSQRLFKLEAWYEQQKYIPTYQCTWRETSV